MKELVVLSGKGGTGKTSIVGSFAAMVKNKVLVDCDVDILVNSSAYHCAGFIGVEGGKIASAAYETGS